MADDHISYCRIHHLPFRGDSRIYGPDAANHCPITGHRLLLWPPRDAEDFDTDDSDEEEGW